jgi:GTP-binding protein HflX
VLNKIDLLEPATRRALVQRNGNGGPIALSALIGEGVPDFLTRIESALSESETLVRVTLDQSDGEGLAWAYAHGRVKDRKDRKGYMLLTVAVDPQELTRFTNHFGDKISPQRAGRA